MSTTIDKESLIGPEANLSYTPIIRGTVVFSYHDEKWTDDGSGKIIPNGSEVLGGGTINYQTGAYSLDILQPIVGDDVSVSYDWNEETIGYSSKGWSHAETFEKIIEGAGDPISSKYYSKVYAKSERNIFWGNVASFFKNIFNI